MDAKIRFTDTNQGVIVSIHAPVMDANGIVSRYSIVWVFQSTRP